MHNNYEKYEKVENLNGTKIISNEPLFKLKTNNLKNHIYERLINDKHYKHILNRDCKVTGNMHDRHLAKVSNSKTKRNLLKNFPEAERLLP